MGGWNPFAAFAGPPPSSQTQQAAPVQSQHVLPSSMPAPPNAPGSTEVDRLRAEVSETQALLRQLIQAQQPAPHAAGRSSAKRGRRATR
jgi:hypothetical protein